MILLFITKRLSVQPSLKTLHCCCSMPCLETYLKSLTSKKAKIKKVPNFLFRVFCWTDDGVFSYNSTDILASFPPSMKKSDLRPLNANAAHVFLKEMKSSCSEKNRVETGGVQKLFSFKTSTSMLAFR